MNRVLQPLAYTQTAAAWPYLAVVTAVVMASAWVVMQSPFEGLSPGVGKALRGGALCALATAVGALPVLVVRAIPQRLSDGLLGFGGVAAGAAGIAKLLFGLFLVLAVVFVVLAVLGVGAVKKALD